MNDQSALSEAIAHHQAGRLAEAEKVYRQILAQQPNHALALNYLGMLAHQAGQHDVAIGLLARSIAAAPLAPEPHRNLAMIRLARGEIDAAIEKLRTAIRLQPDAAEIHTDVAALLEQQGHFDEAIASHRRAASLRPDSLDLRINISRALAAKGAALWKENRRDDARANFREAIATAPDDARWLTDLGAFLHIPLGAERVIALYRRAIELKPDLADAYNNLGHALDELGELEPALSSFRRAIELDPNHASAHSNLLMTMNYQAGLDPAAIFAAHRDWARRFADPLNPIQPAHKNSRDANRRLRIGYVSPNFNRHPVASFIAPILDNHDHARFQIFCYADVIIEDDVTRRLKSSADQWRNLLGASDEEAARIIRDDAIDVLVDLAGHTARHRLLVFARKPAPVQLTYLGYPNTTGLTAIDYRLSDAVADPPGITDRWHSEQLVRLGGTAWCYRAPDNSPAPSLDDSAVTFGSFNNILKMTPAVVEMWSRILRACPQATLLLKSRSLGAESVAQRVRRQFQSHGIEPRRIELLGWQDDPQAHLRLYRRVHVALDTFPYNGTTTTCEALWMGVPVVTLLGDSHAGRVGASLLTSVALDDFIATSADQYIDIAVKSIADRGRLCELRSTLRQCMRASPLMNGPEFTRRIEETYREIWRKWCAS